MTDLLSSYLGTGGGGGGGGSSSLLSSYIGGQPAKKHHSAAYAAALRQAGGGGGGDSGGGLLGGIAEVAGNFLTGAKETAVNFPSAAVHFGDAVWTDFAHPDPRNKRLNDWGFFLQHPVAWAESYYRDPGTFGGKVIEPTVKDVQHRINDPGYALKEDPFGTLLTVLPVTKGLGRFGSDVAEGAGKFSEPRMLKVNGNPVAELRRAKTLQGKARQRLLDQLGEAHPDLPIIGVNSRFDALGQRYAYARTIRDQQPIRYFQEKVQGLTPDEQRAFHVAYARPDIPIDDQLGFFQKQLAQHPDSAALRYRVEELERVKASGVLQNPSPQFVDAVQAARDMQASSTAASIATGKLDKADWRARRQLESAAMLDEPNPSTLLKREADWLAGRIDTGISPEFAAGRKAGSFERRFHHGVTKEKAGAFSTPKASLGTIRVPGQLRRSEGVRLMTGRFITNPEVLSQDAMTQLRYRHALDLQQEILEKVKGELDPNLPGGKPDDAVYYHPTGPVSRAMREDTAVTSDFFTMHPDQIDRFLKEGADGTVFSSTDQAKRLIAAGEKVYWVPKKFGESYRNQFVTTGKSVRLLFDRPTDVWRRLTLGARPAWSINNVVTNATLFALHYAGPRGLVAFLKALMATERGPAKVSRIWKFTFSHPTLRRKYGRLLEEAFPELHQGGFMTSQARVTHPGYWMEDWQRSKLSRLVQAGGNVTLIRPTAKLLNGLVKANLRLNQASERVFRDAAAIREVQKFNDAFGKSNATLQEILSAKEITPDLAMRLTDEVNDALGNFNNLGARERRYIRRVIPFYSWFRTILSVTGKYTARYPERVFMIMEMGKAAQDDPNATLQFAGPSWFEGMLPWGDPKNGEQTALSTSAVNPFSTPAQLGDVAAGLVHGDVATGTNNPGGLLNPFIGSAITAMTGKDTFTGGDYRGPGASEGFIGRFGGDVVSNLAEYRLAQQAFGGRGPIPEYKSKLYDNSTIDYLLNYLGVPVKRIRVKEAKARAGE